MKQISFVDIGAGYKGAHNSGFLDALCSYAKTGEAKVSIITHEALSTEWQSRLHKNNISPIRIFRTNIFELFDNSHNTSQINSYIFQLAQEYRVAFDKIHQLYPENEVHLIFHTMSWEHLSALGLALIDTNISRFKFHLFLMYWCGIDEELQYKDCYLALRYKISLSRLLKYSHVQLYTSNLEYLFAFKKLLGTDNVELHPFFLGDWHYSGVGQKLKDSKNKILLYSGEVKKDKGFYILPEVLKSLQQKWGTDISTVVHLSKKTLNLQQEQIITEGKFIDSKIKIITSFLSTDDILALYKNCDSILLNYDNEAYRNKTSGVMWLAVQLGVTCVVTAETWMHRELLALNVDHFVINEKQELTFIGKYKSTNSDKYLQKIYQPFWEWVKNL